MFVSICKHSVVGMQLKDCGREGILGYQIFESKTFQVALMNMSKKSLSCNFGSFPTFGKYSNLYCI